MAWAQLHLVAPREHVALVEDALLDAGALSITLGDDQDVPILEPGVGETPLWPDVRLSALFDVDCNQALVNDLLDAGCGELVTERRWEVLEDRIWEREWLQHFAPMRFGARLWVCPTDQRVDDPDAVVLSLDPGLAFGTGTHPSTALCLEWLDANPPAGATVIDYGCGSGILAVAALLLGAAKAHAVDIDPQALIATRDNAARNAVDGPALRVSDVSGFAHEPADVLLANILAGVLIELAPRLAALVRTGGSAVLAGILQTQADAVRAAFTPWFDCTATATREEWCRLDLRRNDRPAG